MASVQDESPDEEARMMVLFVAKFVKVALSSSTSTLLTKSAGLGRCTCTFSFTESELSRTVCVM